MRQFLSRALRKFDKLTKEQLESLLVSTSDEVTRLETALDSINSGILVCTKRHRLSLVNRSAERFLHIGDYENTSHTVWQVVQDKEIAAFLQTVLQNGDRVEDKEFNVEKNGLVRRLSISVLPLVEERRVTGSLVLIDDVTERREREALMRRIENLASLTTLAAGVAHEIKNPLGSISIHIQLIKKVIARGLKLCLETHRDNAEFPEPRLGYDSLEKYLNVVTDEIDRLNRIVVDFLYTVRPMKLEPKLGNITVLLAELLDFYHFELEAAHIKTETIFSEDTPPLLYDERAMKQAFLNLLKNAKEAMDGGGILTVTTGLSDDRALISIQDTGCGIAEDHLEKVFEPYWTTKPNGSGLGLLLVFKIIREHGGDISVHSRPGIGARFDITLPLPQKERPRLIFKGGPW
ncbi:MAG: PAS domain-containing protein [Spirochaetaceae bacterium]|jgi:PAS domain S-box-containing protein|nr:PAS domain-containing protein [Spirochaetaceae bacterium]